VVIAQVKEFAQESKKRIKMAAARIFQHHWIITNTRNSLRRFSTLRQQSKFILGIETSCDDTCVALMTDQGQIVASHKHTSLHHQFGGVVPHLAKRQHIKYLHLLIQKVMGEAKLSFGDLQAVGVTAGPGLGLCLAVGFNAAKAICAQNKIPLVPINHIEAHAMVSRICGKDISESVFLDKMKASETSEVANADSTDDANPQTQLFQNLPASDSSTLNNIPQLHTVLPTDTNPERSTPSLEFPFLTLIISGGHSTLAHVSGVGDIQRIGWTNDDACGEAFDKIARILNVSFAFYQCQSTIPLTRALAVIGRWSGTGTSCQKWKPLAIFLFNSILLHTVRVFVFRTQISNSTHV
jgi:hypothetical protein